MEFVTITEASRSKHIPRSCAWIRAAIRMNLIRAERVGNYMMIPVVECKRISADMPKISAQEMIDALAKS